MVLERVLVGVLVMAAGIGCARQAPLESVQARADEKLVSVAATPAAPAAVVPSAAAVEARAEGDLVWLGQASYESDELVAQLRERRGAAVLLNVRVAPEAHDGALAEVLEAAPRAGFEQVRLERAGESLTIATSNGDASVRIIAWPSNDRVVGYDLKAARDTNGLLGPFELASEEGRRALREQLIRACQDPCRAELDLVPQTPPRIWQTLSAWQQSAGSVPTLSYRVLAMVPRPSSGKPPPGPATASTPPVAKPPKVKLGATTVSGRIPPTVIQHIVRHSFEKFRSCYEAGLGRNSELTGRVSARFVIDRTGKVSNVADGGSDIPDPEVVSCVLKMVYTLEFPPPANGIVTVVYPIMFAPG